jgi:DnaJ-class molecular chaperone
VTDERALAVLGCPPDASEAQIKTCYRAALHAAHPDRGGTADRLADVLAAWRALQASAHARTRCRACAGTGRQKVRAGFSAVSVVCADCRGSGRRAL